MQRFDTKVQYLRYRVLREVARHAFDDTLLQSFSSILRLIAPGPKPTMRCCVYKERAILAERIQIAIDGIKDDESSVIKVIDIACDECPVGGYEVSVDCRGCIAHRCEEACPRGAIYFDDNQKAHIDKSKCIECGKCASVCPYQAITNRKRPCIRSCKVNAISMNEDMVAVIDDSKCIECGSCVYQCPFGAISDKTYIIAVVEALKKALQDPENNKVYAIVAPAIASQFRDVKLGQVAAGLLKLGFDDVLEVALGADMVAWEEAKELVEKGFLTSSCCPAFVKYIEKHQKDMLEHKSHNMSPMAYLGMKIKEREPNAKVVFIGPCVAKKSEILRPEVRPYVDYVLTFEELQALYGSRDIILSELEEVEFGGASGFGRVFARSGGLTEAVRRALDEQEVVGFDLKPVMCDGIEECRAALLKARHGSLGGNFIEGMACVGGCINGAGCITHSPRSRGEVDKYGRAAGDLGIKDAIDQWDKK
ncbi:MAG: 4Fe-4S dicluster domain-containing protein [Clostridia bacterium]|nr:4Fe-4S dicluster domain-containing protein [Clostridia bacterium]MBQ2326014.1 4Fe-4S dicluster domain-containing protein [Clostridia bacterium]